MNKVKFLKALIALGVVAACGCMLAACSGGSQSSAGAGGTGGVAAIVNGTEIMEDEITDQIQLARQQYGLEEDEAWGEFLVSNGMTPADIRSDFVDQRVDDILVKAGIQELGLTVEDSEVDSYVDSMRGNFDSDEAWEEALEQAGFTEDSYRESIKESLLQQKLNEHFEEQASTTDEDTLESANTIASYYNGARRSSYILFAVDDPDDEQAKADAKARAQAVLDQISAGADFAELAKQNSDNEATAAKGGDAGWDVTNYICEEYSDALGQLDANVVSDLVESEDGFYIIKCTEVFTAPEKVTDLNQIPEDFRESVVDMAHSNKVQDDYNAWLDGLRKAADIVINDIPADVPYNIDLTPYETADSDVDVKEGDGEGDDVEVTDDDGETADGDNVIVVEEGDGDEVDGATGEVDVELEEASKDEAK